MYVLVELFFEGLWTELMARSINLQKNPKVINTPKQTKQASSISIIDNGSIFMEFADKLRHLDLFTLHTGTQSKAFLMLLLWTFSLNFASQLNVKIFVL